MQWNPKLFSTLKKSIGFAYIAKKKKKQSKTKHGSLRALTMKNLVV